MESSSSSLISSSFSYSSLKQTPKSYYYYNNNINNTYSSRAATAICFRKIKLQISNSSSSSSSSRITRPLKAAATTDSPPNETTLPKTDRSGRFCSPRAARELALMIVYASCLQGSDPVRLFDKRINAKREPGYEFDKSSLLDYNHMSFGGPPLTVDTIEEANDLERTIHNQSAIEAEILSAPPKLVYSTLLLRFTRKLLVSVAERWDSHVLIIDQIVPENWKNEPASKILELCILHLAMSEITVVGTRHQIVINEAVDLAKRFCDGAAPRIINGCLGTFIKGLIETESPVEPKQQVSVEAVKSLT
ncbi:hypothetical protein ACFE04_001676 [Oxalis oulophora]